MIAKIPVFLPLPAVPSVDPATMSVMEQLGVIQRAINDCIQKVNEISEATGTEAGFLPLTGGTLTGDLTINKNNPELNLKNGVFPVTIANRSGVISLETESGRPVILGNLKDPEDPADAVNKKTMERNILEALADKNFIPADGGTVTGTIEMQSGEIVFTSGDRYTRVKQDGSVLRLLGKNGLVRVSGVAYPQQADEAVSLAYLSSRLDDYVAANADGEISGNLDVSGTISAKHITVDNDGSGNRPTVGITSAGSTAEPKAYMFTSGGGRVLVGNVLDPVSGSDAATKNYVDSLIRDTGGLPPYDARNAYQMLEVSGDGRSVRWSIKPYSIEHLETDLMEEIDSRALPETSGVLGQNFLVYDQGGRPRWESTGTFLENIESDIEGIWNDIEPLYAYQREPDESQGKMLYGNEITGKPEWRTPREVPQPTQADYMRVLACTENTGGTYGYKWVNAPLLDPADYDEDGQYTLTATVSGAGTENERVTYSWTKVE